MDYRAILPSQVDQILTDLDFVREGTRIFFAVDTKDIIDFCFPVALTTGQRSAHIDDVADDQVILYEVLYSKTITPLLLPEYRQELEAAYRVLSNQIWRAYGAMEIVDRLAEKLRLKHDAGESTEEIVEYIARHFNQVLAVAMGIYKIGIERLADLLENRLASEAKLAGHKEERAIIDAIWKGYSESPLSNTIADWLDTLFLRGRFVDRDFAYEHLRIREANKVDALAVDRLIYLNNQLEAAYSRARLKKRSLILYLSSSSRTRNIFGMREVRDALPTIHNFERYPLWRTKEEVLAYLVNRGTSKRRSTRLAQTIRGLLDFRKVIEEAGRLRHIYSQVNRRCEQCIVLGGRPTTCEWSALCENVSRIESSLTKLRNRSENLGLLSAIESYREFMEARPTMQTHIDIVDFIRKLYASKDVRKQAIRRMKDMLSLIKVKSLFASMLPDALAQGIESSEDIDVSNLSIRHIPIDVKLADSRLQNVLASVLDYYLSAPAPGVRLRKAIVMEEAYSRFLEIDQEDQLVEEIEVVRTILYLAFPLSYGDKEAYDHALRMISEGAVREADFRYVLVWAARRLGEYRTADLYSSQAIRSFPKDPRFYYGRALNLYLWIVSRSKEGPRRLTFARAVADAERAIELYKSSENMNLYIGSCLNLLAYMRSFDPKKGFSAKVYDIVQARRRLRELKKIVPKETWYVSYPEYLHTEAHLEFQEYKDMRRSRRESWERVRKLQYALYDVAAAQRLNPASPLYRALHRNIALALDSETAALPTTIVDVSRVSEA